MMESELLLESLQASNCSVVVADAAFVCVFRLMHNLIQSIPNQLTELDLNHFSCAIHQY